MVSGPLLQTLVEHFHNYIIVRKNCELVIDNTYTVNFT